MTSDLGVESYTPCLIVNKNFEKMKMNRSLCRGPKDKVTVKTTTREEMSGLRLHGEN